MTKIEALDRAAKNLEIHRSAADTFSGCLALEEQKRAEVCKIIIDIIMGEKPTGNVEEALYALKKEEAEYKAKLAYSMTESIYPRYSKEYKECVDWYGCCIGELEDYLLKYGSDTE